MALSVIYGLSVETDGMDYITMAENGLQLLSNNIAPSGSLWAVDIFPFLRNLPSWFPFASFKRKANEWKPQIVEFVEKPYAAAKQKITVTILSHLILAMIKHPNVLKRAQQEIYKVVGSRLPTFEDRPRLPYVECLPHTLSQDDEYQHTHLPKGTLVIANILYVGFFWALVTCSQMLDPRAMLRDEELFPDAEAFVPERYEAMVPEDVQRRMNPRQRCPGVNLVESSLWLSVCSILAALDISRAVDQNGKDIEAEAVYENLVFSDEKQEEEWVRMVTFIAPEGVKVMNLQLSCDAESSFPEFGMWLDPTHPSGKGLERKLMEEGLRSARNTWESRVPEERYADMQVVLEVRKGNMAAEMLYRSVGFKETDNEEAESEDSTVC
ncbi:hypothetical protein PHLCEN_2v13476 [Hermanssonia centrifuga]|uniref:Cytochrome P450 n=1 Tax=Hermanssonia centrifuga TaxID=98765 RepID=A0A2R6NE43_9APHY|nr:hypothetical protein PHLCEN_2v13476 [Hermanssonia centrifuga]